jgi:hypothetical protein
MTSETLGVVKEDEEDEEDEHGHGSERVEAYSDDDDEEITPAPTARVRGVSRGNSKFMRVKGGTAQLVVDKPQAAGLEASLMEQERKESMRREEENAMEARGLEATATASSVTLVKKGNGTAHARGGLQASQPMEPRRKALQEEDLGDGGPKGSFEI